MDFTQVIEMRILWKCKKKWEFIFSLLHIYKDQSSRGT